ncbi:DUF2071 domain-containing protein [Lederbergia sp. NSJ-179]|uniref:YqjF family protein n=1 Tax=Lederbergia sp. NSJ-179 TaxID=2931402 RepID=UPI001FD1A8BD|nr:DUF2071 domain-containing protein [Lederbergia sp. NSJ-179]MCJ7842651.1 DUF2071 domain-containing protein [Lederbergia sp. NSJ-179]
MHKAFLETNQRPFPLPESRWLMTQTWNHLLFCHWPIDEKVIQPLIPPEFELDKFAGKAWLGVIPFQVTDMRIRGLPKPPYLHTYLELNIRTYVTYKGTPGIYFLALDADKWSAVWGGKIGALLPYRKANMEMQERKNRIHFQSKPLDPSQKERTLSIQYQPISESYSPTTDSLEYWLFERYCFFILFKNRVFRGDIHHNHWKVSQAVAKIDQPFFFTLFQNRHDAPLFHYTRKKQAFMWMLNKVES